MKILLTALTMGAPVVGFYFLARLIWATVKGKETWKLIVGLLVSTSIAAAAFMGLGLYVSHENGAAVQEKTEANQPTEQEQTKASRISGP